MRILFIQTNTYSLLTPTPLGAALVADRLKKDGHDVRFLDLMFERDPRAAVVLAANDQKPELVCCSIRNRDNMNPADYKDPIPEIAGLISDVRRAAPAPVLLGGTAFSTFPRRILQATGAEYGICGDDLEPISSFITSLARVSPDLSTPGLVYRGGDGATVENPFTVKGYRDVAFNDCYAMIDLKKYRKGYWQAGVVTRTGCPEKCAYCDTYRTFGREFQLRDPAVVAEEMLRLKRTGKVRSVFLIDAGFNRPLDHAKEVLAEIIRRGAQLHLNCVFDPGEADKELFRLFRRAGGLIATIFAESLSDRVLEQLSKPFRSAEIFRDSAMMRKEGIHYMMMPTFGSPGETQETIEETLGMLPKLGAAFMDFSIGWRIQPMTPLFDRAVAEGLISQDHDCYEAKYYVSPMVPRTWIEQRLKAFKRRHPMVMWLGIVPFAWTVMTRKPWKLGPEATV